MMQVKLIDKYIYIQFLRNLLFALLCFILIFILVDLFENLDKFIDNKLDFYTVLKYYFYFIPEIIKLITPISMLLATLFTVGRMINFNEIVAVKNAGVSLIRFMAPFLAIGFVVTCISLYFNNWTVPEANKKKFYIERNYLQKNLNIANFNRLYFQDHRNQLIFIEQFKEIDLSADKVSLLLYNPDSLTKLEQRIDAEKMIWKNEKWVFIKAALRSFRNGTEVLTIYEKIPSDNIIDILPINLKPQQIIKKQLKPDEMTYTEIKDFLDSQVKGGQSADRTLVDYYSKISFPFSNLIVIIFGISISTGSRKRKGLAMQFGISILVSFVYLGFVKISQTFGYNGDLNPVLTAWLANLVFTSAGSLNLYFKNY